MSITSVKSGATGISLALDNNFMEPIATTLVGSTSVNQVTFNDIPQTYKHLQLRCFARLTTGSSNVSINFNSDTSANYAEHQLYGDGSSAGASATTSATYLQVSGRAISTANIGAVFILDILDYANTNKNKTLRGLQGWDENGSGTLRFTSGLWMSTIAIESIKLAPISNNFAQYSRFSLYGIKG